MPRRRCLVAGQPADADDDVDGEGFRMPATQVERGVEGRRTETAQARTRGPAARRYGDLRILLRMNEWRVDCGMGLTLGT